MYQKVRRRHSWVKCGRHLAERAKAVRKTRAQLFVAVDRRGSNSLRREREHIWLTLVKTVSSFCSGDTGRTMWVWRSFDGVKELHIADIIKIYLVF